MAEKKETVFKKRIVEDLKRIKRCWFVKIQQVVICGTPDFMVCVNGKFVALELKKDDESFTTMLQDYNLDKIRDAKGVALIVSPKSWPEQLKYLKLLSSS